MNTREKALYYLGIILLLTSAGLRIPHLIDSSEAYLLMSFGFSLCFIAYGRYTRRLKVRNAELEQQVRQLRSVQL